MCRKGPTPLDRRPVVYDKIEFHGEDGSGYENVAQMVTLA